MSAVEPAFLLDSNICIYVLDGREDRLMLRRRIEQERPGRVVTSAIGYAEVKRGRTRPGPDFEARVEALFRSFPVQPFDKNAALRFRDVPLSRGRFDRLIAAHALALGVTLITNNERDFSDVPDLKIENWTTA